MPTFKKNTGFSLKSSPTKYTYNSSYFGQPRGYTSNPGQYQIIPETQKPSGYGTAVDERMQRARDKMNTWRSKASRYVGQQKYLGSRSQWSKFRKASAEKAPGEIYEEGYAEYQKKLNAYKAKPVLGMFGRNITGADMLKLQEKSNKPATFVTYFGLNKRFNNRNLQALHDIYKGTHKKVKMKGASTLGDISGRPMPPPSMLTFKRKNRFKKK